MNTALCAKIVSVETELKQIKDQLKNLDEFSVFSLKSDLKRLLEKPEGDRLLVVLEELAHLLKVKKQLLETVAAKEVILEMLQRHQDDCLIQEDKRQKLIAEIKAPKE